MHLLNKHSSPDVGNWHFHPCPIANPENFTKKICPLRYKLTFFRVRNK